MWGEHEATAIWDAAIVKLILGGGSNARDLDDLSRLIGQRTETQHTENISGDGHRSRSVSTREVPIMDCSRLRMLPFGTGVLLLRAARPIWLDLRSWKTRKDAAVLRAGQARLETQISRAGSPAAAAAYDGSSRAAS